MLTCNSINFPFGQAAILIGSQRASSAAVAHCLAEFFFRGATVKEPPLNETPSQRYYRTHRDEVLAKARAKHAANPEISRQRDRRYAERNPERLKETQHRSDRKRRHSRAAQYESNRDARLTSNRKWRERSKAEISAYNSAYYQTHKVEHQARSAVKNALKEGRLVKPAGCQRCPTQTSALIGHHHSYEPQYWLDVEWLCKKCHMRHHAEEDARDN